ncbi:MAG: hypothetical protein AB7P04_02545 [Bacteriovoracia bacterium]
MPKAIIVILLLGLTSGCSARFFSPLVYHDFLVCSSGASAKVFALDRSTGRSASTSTITLTAGVSGNFAFYRRSAVNMLVAFTAELEVFSIGSQGFTPVDLNLTQGGRPLVARADRRMVLVSDTDVTGWKVFSFDDVGGPSLQLEQAFTFPHASSSTHYLLSSNGRTLLRYQDARIQAHAVSAVDFSLVNSGLYALKNNTPSAATHPSRDRVAVAHFTGGFDHVISVLEWDASSSFHEVASVVPSSMPSVSRIAWSPDGQWIVMHDGDELYFYRYDESLESLQFSFKLALSSITTQNNVPIWSPDSSRLYVHDGGAIRMLSRDADGNAYTLLSSAETNMECASGAGTMAYVAGTLPI